MDMRYALVTRHGAEYTGCRVDGRREYYHRWTTEIENTLTGVRFALDHILALSERELTREVIRDLHTHTANAYRSRYGIPITKIDWHLVLSDEKEVSVLRGIKN